MNEYPSEWNLVPIREIITESRINPELDDPSKRVSVRLHCEGVEKRSERATDQSGATRYYKRLAGQFIYGKQNLHKGAVGIVPTELHGFCSSQDIPAFDITPSVDPNWFLYLFKQRNFYEALESIATGTGSKRIQPSELGEKEIAVPPLPEQKKIAEILSGIDKFIHFLKNQRQKLETAKIALSNELLSGRSDSCKESPYGSIPDHWSESTLGAVIGMENMQTGPFGSQLHAHEYTSEGTPVIMPQDMKNCGVVTDKIARITPQRAESLEKHKVIFGDILFSRRGDIGRHTVIYENESGWICGTGCLRVRTKGRMHPIFLSELLRHRFAIEWMNANAVGQTMLNLNTGILSELPVVAPPSEEQVKIASSLSSIGARSKKINAQIAIAETLKVAVSSDLLSGRKRVRI